MQKHNRELQTVCDTYRQNAEAQITTLGLQNTDCNNTIQSIKTKLDDMKTENEENRVHISQLRQFLGEFAQKITDDMSTTYAGGLHIQELQAFKNKLDYEITTKEGEIQRLHTHHKEEIKNIREQTQKQITDLSTQLQSSQNQIEIQKEKITRLEANNTDKDSTIRDLQLQLQNLLTDVQTKTTEYFTIYLKKDVTCKIHNYRQNMTK